MGAGGMGKGDRSIMHIFPAEVNATRYEGRLSDLGQPIRLLVNDVTLQMEDLPRLKLFLLCYIYGLIQRGSVLDRDTGSRLNIWQLHIEPDKTHDEYGNPTQALEIWLTEAQSDPHILDALTTFNYEERDARFKQGHVHEIDYGEVAAALRRARDADVAQRLQEDTAGTYSPDLLQQASAVDADTRQTILQDLAQIDRIREYQNRFKGEILPALEKRKERDPEQQKDYDVVSVFTLMLDDEVRGVRKTVRNRLTALRHLGKRDAPATIAEEEDDDVSAW